MASAEQPSHEVKAEEKPKVSRDQQNLTVAYIQFLRQKVSINDSTAEQAEAIEVAVQCLEGAFALSDKNYAYQPNKPLLETFKEAEGSSTSEEEEFPKATPEDVERANKLKEEGNELVKASKFDEAVRKYNEAIQLNRDPIYFCNRAAAYCRLEQNDLAIQDCRTALALDPSYAKAYGRMAVALSCQHRYDQAVEAYKRALELDPSNESYKTNMTIAEEKQREAQQMNTEGGGMPGGFGGFPGMGGLGGLGGFLNNPQMTQMAAQMMSDPNVQNMMGQMMNAFGGGAGGPPGGAPGDGAPGGGPGLDGLMRVGEQIAETLQQSNPQLVEQLRQQFNATRGPSNGDEEQQGGGGGASEQPPPSS